METEAVASGEKDGDKLSDGLCVLDVEVVTDRVTDKLVDRETESVGETETGGDAET